MKKKFIALLLALCACFGISAFAACKDEENPSKTSDSTQLGWGKTFTVETAYAQAQELGYEGSLEEFIDAISGKDGKDGVDGKDGSNGKDGVDGKDGVGISNVSVNAEGMLVVTFTDGKTVQAGKIPGVVTATYPTVSFAYKLSADETAYEILAVISATQSDIAIPSSYNSKPVRAICASALRAINWLTSVTISNGIQTIGNHAFAYCENLTSVSIPSSVQTIEEYAFYDCANLSSVTFETPSSLQTVGNYAFAYCENLTSVSIPSSVQTIEEYAFFDCANLSSVTFETPSSLQTVGNYAFAYCNLTSATFQLPSSVTSIGNNVSYPWSYEYASSSSLSKKSSSRKSSSSIESSWEEESSIEEDSSWEDYSSEEKSSSEDETYGLTYTLSADESYYIVADYNSYSGENTVEIPATYNGLPVKEIGASAFYYCTSLTSVTIPDSVTTIGSYAFYYCYSLTSVTIPDSVTTIGSYAFYNCTGLTEIYFNATAMNALSSSNYIFSCAGQSGTGITVHIGANVTKIPAYLFYSYSGSSHAPNITSVVFAENSVCESIGSYAFSSCTSLSEITIPSIMLIIDACAFYCCTGLTSVTIPSSLLMIGDSAFYGCNKLVEVVDKSSLGITAGSTDNGYVGYYAKQVITDKADSKLKMQGDYLVYEDGENSVLLAYYGTATELVLPDDINGNTYQVYKYAFYENATITSVTIGSGVTTIGSYAFYGCTSLSEITIPSSVTTIGSYAFYYCYSLTSVTIPEGVTTIGERAFYNCTGLTEIYFNATAMEDLADDNYVFSCAGQSGTGITVHIGANVTKIPAYLFYSYSSYSGSSHAPNITSVVFAENSVCESIGDYAFAYCGNLTSITIPSSVTSIGYRAFYNCSNLSSATFESTSDWFVSTSSTATSGTDVTISTTSVNAIYLYSAYSDYYWKQKES